jgi:hypothetical protein
MSYVEKHPGRFAGIMVGVTVAVIVIIVVTVILTRNNDNNTNTTPVGPPVTPLPGPTPPPSAEQVRVTTFEVEEGTALVSGDVGYRLLFNKNILASTLPLLSDFKVSHPSSIVLSVESVAPNELFLTVRTNSVGTSFLVTLQVPNQIRATDGTKMLNIGLSTPIVLTLPPSPSVIFETPEILPAYLFQYAKNTLTLKYSTLMSQAPTVAGFNNAEVILTELLADQQTCLVTVQPAFGQENRSYTVAETTSGAVDLWGRTHFPGSRTSGTYHVVTTVLRADLDLINLTNEPNIGVSEGGYVPFRLKFSSALVGFAGLNGSMFTQWNNGTQQMGTPVYNFVQETQDQTYLIYLNPPLYTSPTTTFQLKFETTNVTDGVNDVAVLSADSPNVSFTNATFNDISNTIVEKNANFNLGLNFTPRFDSISNIVLIGNFNATDPMAADLISVDGGLTFGYYYEVKMQYLNNSGTTVNYSQSIAGQLLTATSSPPLAIIDPIAVDLSLDEGPNFIYGLSGAPMQYKLTCNVAPAVDLSGGTFSGTIDGTPATVTVASALVALDTLHWVVQLRVAEVGNLELKFHPPNNTPIVSQAVNGTELSVDPTLTIAMVIPLKPVLLPVANTSPIMQMLVVFPYEISSIPTISDFSIDNTNLATLVSVTQDSPPTFFTLTLQASPTLTGQTNVFFTSTTITAVQVPGNSVRSEAGLVFVTPDTTIPLLNVESSLDSGKEWENVDEIANLRTLVDGTVNIKVTGVDTAVITKSSESNQAWRSFSQAYHVDEVWFTNSDRYDNSFPYHATATNPSTTSMVVPQGGSILVEGEYLQIALTPHHATTAPVKTIMLYSAFVGEFNNYCVGTFVILYNNDMEAAGSWTKVYEQLTPVDWSYALDRLSYRVDLPVQTDMRYLRIVATSGAGFNEFHSCAISQINIFSGDVVLGATSRLGTFSRDRPTSERYMYRGTTETPTNSSEVIKGSWITADLLAPSNDYDIVKFRLYVPSAADLGDVLAPKSGSLLLFITSISDWFVAFSDDLVLNKTGEAWYFEHVFPSPINVVSKSVGKVRWVTTEGKSSEVSLVQLDLFYNNNII